MSNEGRSHNISIEIKATPEEVWRQITEAEGIQRWLAPIAAVIPGLGGKLMLSWGPGMEGEGPITSWEPNHKFGWTERAETDAPRIVEFTIEARDGGTTLLTLVHSGFSSDASFDTEYESTSGGWRSMLAVLKYDLERFAGQPARHELRMQMLDRAPAGILPALLKTIHFERQGQSYTARLDGGLALHGEVLFERGEGYLLLTLASIAGGGVLGLFAEGCGAGTVFTTSWNLRGAAVSQAAEIMEIWDAALKQFEAQTLSASGTSA